MFDHIWWKRLSDLSLSFKCKYKDVISVKVERCKSKQTNVIGDWNRMNIYLLQYTIGGCIMQRSVGFSIVCKCQLVYYLPWLIVQKYLYIHMTGKEAKKVCTYMTGKEAKKCNGVPRNYCTVLLYVELFKAHAVVNWYCFIFLAF